MVRVVTRVDYGSKQAKDESLLWCVQAPLLSSHPSSFVRWPRSKETFVRLVMPVLLSASIIIYNWPVRYDMGLQLSQLLSRSILPVKRYTDRASDLLCGRLC